MYSLVVQTDNSLIPDKMKVQIITCSFLTGSVGIVSLLRPLIDWKQHV